MPPRSSPRILPWSTRYPGLREQSLRQLIDRVVKTYRKAGEDFDISRRPFSRGVRA